MKDKLSSDDFDRLTITVPKGWATEIKDFAESRGEDLDNFCIGAIANKIQLIVLSEKNSKPEE